MAVAPKRSFIPYLLIVVVALIAYGSLYPFNFKPDAIEGGLLHALGELTWARAGRSDRVANVLLYLPFGFCLFLWCERHTARVWSLLIAVLGGVLLSLAIEVSQVYVSARVPSLTDWLLNALGSLIGAVAGLVWRAAAHLMHLPARIERPTRDAAAGFLILLWLAWRLAPFVPQLDLGKLKSALRPLMDPQLHPAMIAVFLCSWLIVNHAIGALVSRARRLEALLLLIAAVLVGRLLVANQTFVPDELAALVLLLPIIVLMHRLHPLPRRIVLLASAVLLVGLRELAPWQLASEPSSFDLWPFRAWLEAGIEGAPLYDWSAFFGSVFVFGALAFTLRECRVPIGAMVALVTSIALVVELAQMWIVDQRASITMPLAALGIALAYRALYLRSPKLRWRVEG